MLSDDINGFHSFFFNLMYRYLRQHASESERSLRTVRIVLFVSNQSEPDYW